MGEHLRTAVVFVHGQGEHRPMGAAPELARTAWATDPASNSDGDVYIVPDVAVEAGPTPSATARGHGADRVQFFEFYWSHLMTGNKLGHVRRWFQRMINKPREQTPQRIADIRQGIVRVAEAGIVFAAGYAFLVASLFVWANGWLDETNLDLIDNRSQGFEWLHTGHPTYDGTTLAANYDALADAQCDLSPDRFLVNHGADPVENRAFDPVNNCEHRLSSALFGVSCNYDDTALFNDIYHWEGTQQSWLFETRSDDQLEGACADALLALPATAAAQLEARIDEDNDPQTVTSPERRAQIEYEFRLERSFDLRITAWVLLALTLPVLISFIVLLFYETDSRPRPVRTGRTITQRVLDTARDVGGRLAVLAVAIGVLTLFVWALSRNFSLSEYQLTGRLIPADADRRWLDYMLVISCLVLAFIVYFLFAWVRSVVRAGFRVLGLAHPISVFFSAMRGPAGLFVLAVLAPLFLVLTIEYAADQDTRLFITQAMIVLGLGAIIALWARWLITGLVLAGIVTPLAVIAAISGLDLTVFSDVGEPIWANADGGDLSYVVPGWTPPFVAETYTIMLVYFVSWAVISVTVDAIRPRIAWMTGVSIAVTAVFYYLGAAYDGALIKWEMQWILVVWTGLALVAFVGVVFAFWMASQSFLVPTMADTARYLGLRPGDIERRRAVLAEGLELLDGLHRSRRFDRIVIVAHSLGSIVALDLLTRYWARRWEWLRDSVTQPAFEAVSTAARRLESEAPKHAHDAANALERARAALGGRGSADAPETDDHWAPAEHGAAGLVEPHERAEAALDSLARRLSPAVGRRRAKVRDDVASEDELPAREARARAVELLRDACHSLEMGVADYDVVAESLRRVANRVREAAELPHSPAPDEGPLEGGQDRAARAAEELRKAAHAYAAGFALLSSFRAAQRRLSNALASRPDPEGGDFLANSSGHEAPPPTRWLVTDFVTVGSPLTYADYLLVDNADDFDKRMRAGRIPACPPVAGAPASACFAPMRWTNLFFYAQGVLKLAGDIVGGRVWTSFGLGAVDVDLRQKRPNGMLFAHNEYWKSKLDFDELMGEATPEHVRAMRAALALAVDRDLDLADA